MTAIAATARRATTQDAEDLTRVLMDGFSDEPCVAGWMFPTPSAYRSFAHGWFSAYTDYCLKHGAAWIVEDAGAVLTMPSQAWTASLEDAELHARIARTTGPHMDRVEQLDIGLIHRHPLGEDHHYLPLIGVRPGHRGSGVGSLLLQAVDKLSQDDDLPVYLEATTADSARLYARHGFQQLPGARISLPGLATELTPMMLYPTHP